MQGREIEILEKFAKMAVDRMHYYLSFAIEEMKRQEYHSADCMLKQFLALSEFTRHTLAAILEDMKERKEEEEHE